MFGLFAAMTVTYTSDSIFDSTADVLVNPVNCVGIMGKGLAAEYKRRYPVYFEDYKDDCKEGSIQLGKPVIYFQAAGEYRHIVSFPTKHHWREKSTLDNIEKGLALLKLHLKQYYRDKPVTVAMPQLGCGLGGLNWDDVHRVIVDLFADETNIRVDIHIRDL